MFDSAIFTSVIFTVKMIFLRLSHCEGCENTHLHITSTSHLKRHVKFPQRLLCWHQITSLELLTAFDNQIVPPLLLFKPF